MNKRVKNSVTLVVAVLLIGIGMSAFAEANYLDSPLLIYGYITLVGLLIICHLNWLLELLLSLVILVGCCYRYFPLGHRFSFKWFAAFGTVNSDYFLRREAVGYRYLPESLGLILMLLFSYLLLKLVLNYRIWQLPFVFIVSYLVILSVVNQTEQTEKIIYAIIISFILAAWLQASRQERPINYYQLIVVSFIVIGGAYSAWQFPKWFPTTQTRLETETALVRQELRSSGIFDQFDFSRNGQVGTTGFSDNDEVLGGAIFPNNDPVFTAKSTKSRYWKVETKDYYSGKGWESTVDDRQSIDHSTFMMTEGLPNDQGQSEPISVTFAKPLTYFPKPAGKIVWQVPDDLMLTGELDYNEFSNRVYLPTTTGLTSLAYAYYEPTYKVEQLEEARAIYDLSADNPYTQLPESLPWRVTTLARQLVMNAPSDYAKVQAVESYLKNDIEFTYSMSAAEKVPQNRDYVDHFLFDSQVGYCEQFSTAMVVMLRSVKIPARWVKGFNGGTEVEKAEDGRKVYNITNADAHAWPEVYFSGIGWVPFEPTKSFISQEQTTLLTRTENASAEPDPLTATPEAEPARSQGIENTDQALPEETDLEGPGAEQADQAKSFPIYVRLLLVVSGSGLLLGSFFLAKNRFSWLLFFSLLKVRPSYPVNLAFTRVLNLLERVEKRPSSETVREYYARLSLSAHPLPVNFLKLLERYEQGQYGKQAVDVLSKKEVKYLHELDHWTRLKSKRKTGRKLPS